MRLSKSLVTKKQCNRCNYRFFKDNKLVFPRSLPTIYLNTQTSFPRLHFCTPTWLILVKLTVVR